MRITVGRPLQAVPVLSLQRGTEVYWDPFEGIRESQVKDVTPPADPDSLAHSLHAHVRARRHSAIVLGVGFGGVRAGRLSPRADSVVCARFVNEPTHQRQSCRLVAFARALRPCHVLRSHEGMKRDRTLVQRDTPGVEMGRPYIFIQEG